MFKRFTVVCFLLFPSLLLAQAPITVSDQYAFNFGHASFSAQEANVLESDAYKLSFSSVWSNTAIREGSSYLVDNESVELRSGLRYGIGNSLELAVDVAALWQGGGRLDRFLDSYHQRLGLPRGDRPALSDNDYQVSAKLEQGQSIEINDNRLQLANSALSIKYSLINAQGLALSVMQQLALPTPDFENSGFDSVSALLASYRLGAFTLHAGIAEIVYTDNHRSDLEYEKFQTAGYIASVYQLTETSDLSLILNAKSQSVANIVDHPASIMYLDMGYRYRYTVEFAIVLLIREDVLASSGSTDISFMAGVELW